MSAPSLHLYGIRRAPTEREKSCKAHTTTAHILLISCLDRKRGKRGSGEMRVIASGEEIESAPTVG